MANTKWIVPAETNEKLSSAMSELRAELEELREQYDDDCGEKPAWAEGAKATSIELWLSEWEDFIDTYDSLDSKPEK